MNWFTFTNNLMNWFTFTNNTNNLIISESSSSKSINYNNSKHMSKYSDDTNKNALAQMIAAKTRKSYTIKFNSLYFECFSLIDFISKENYDDKIQKYTLHYTQLLSQYKNLFFDKTRHDSAIVYNKLVKLYYILLSHK